MGHSAASEVVSPAMQETWEIWVQSLGREDPQKQEMETHSGILVWKIPRIDEPGGLPVRHDLLTEYEHALSHYITFCHI